MLDTKAIKNAKYYIAKLTKNLSYIKSDKGKQAEIDMINAFIKLVNAYEALAMKRENVELVEKLLLGRFYAMLRAGDAPDKTVDIPLMVELLDENLRYPKSLFKERVVSYLFSKEIELTLFENRNADAQTALTAFKDAPEKEEWSMMVDDLLNQLITKRLWN